MGWLNDLLKEDPAHEVARERIVAAETKIAAMEFENVRLRGQQIREGLERLKARFDFIREIRGEGLMIGLELSVDGAPCVTEALRQGLVINCTHDFTLRFLPPFIIREKQVREFFDKLESILRRARKSLKTSGTPETKTAAARPQEGSTKPEVDEPEAALQRR